MKNQFFTICLMMIFVACQNAPKDQVIDESVDSLALSQNSPLPVQTDAVLENNVWLLQEINGQVIDSSGLEEPPSILFRGEDRKYIAKTDCNGIAGDYQLGTDHALQFLELFHTEMACPNMEVEKGLLEHLPHVRTYSVDGQQLILKDNKQAVIAKLSLNK